MRQSDDDQELLRNLQRLPREVPPRVDPWPGIEARISRSRRAGMLRLAQNQWLLRAAAAVLVIGLALGMILGPQWAVAPGLQRSVIADRGGAVRAPAALPMSLAGSEAEYQAAFREFIGIGQARPALSQQTVDQIATGWADLRTVELAVMRALAADPDNRFLNDRMLELRARQLAFLRELASLDQSNRRRMI